MVVSNWDSSNTTSGHIPAFTNTPVRVAGIGFGCVAIRTSLVAAMQKPCFEAHIYLEGHPPRARVCNEDYLFCERLRRTGHDVVLHAGVRCGHYDRHSGKTISGDNESIHQTSIERMAAMVNGVPALVPLCDAPTTAERHERAELTYIRPQ